MADLSAFHESTPGTVAEIYGPEWEEIFGDILSSAEGNASSDWEETFVSDMIDKFDQYKSETFLSQAQQEKLEMIAWR